VAAFDDYAVMAPMLHEMHFVFAATKPGLPYAASGKDSIDQINCATVFRASALAAPLCGHQGGLGGNQPGEAIQDLDAP